VSVQKKKEKRDNIDTGRTEGILRSEMTSILKKIKMAKLTTILKMKYFCTK
jgi:hypothetical protein